MKTPEQFVSAGFTPEQSAFIVAAIAQSKTEILRDIAAGTVPADVADFATLHDFVDANCYGGLCDEAAETDAIFPHDADDDPEVLNSEQFTRACNEIQGAVNAWLVAGRPE